MPVSGTPLPSGCGSQSAPAPGLSTPRPSTVDGEAVTQRTDAIVARHGVRSTLEWTLRAPDGRPLDLSDVVADGGGAVSLRGREAAVGQIRIASAAGTLVEPGCGLVRFLIDAEDGPRPAIYRCEVVVTDVDAVPIVSRPVWLWVEPDASTRRGPIERDELRMALRDSSALENRLLREDAHSDAELAICLVRAVEAYNAIPPPTRVYSTADFPFRQAWIEAARAGAARLAAEWYRRNHLPYTGGGLSADDMAKAPELEAVADRAWTRFEIWARERKASDNLSVAYDVIPGGYFR